MTVNFGATAVDYAAYRRPFPPELLRRLATFGVGRAGQQVLDLGSGTGLLARPLAAAGCHVVAVDISDALLKQAGVAQCGSIQPVIARVESLPFARGAFEVVTAAQSWHWFDRRVAPREIWRVLAEGGLLAVAYQMYLPLPGNVAEMSERLIVRFNPRWRHANSVGINGQVLRDMQLAGFIAIESFSFDTTEAYSHENWRGLIRTTSAVGASMLPDRVADFDREHAVMLQNWPEPLTIAHRVFAAVAHKPGAGL